MAAAGLVSVVTAVRNGAAAIGATLESVASQTYPAIEHVIVDGASTDGTMEVVHAHPARLGTVVSERDAGVYDAFNKGLRNARGEWVLYMGAGDCFARTDAIAKLVALGDAENSELVYSDLAIVEPATGKLERLYSSAGFSGDRIRDGFMPGHPALLIRRGIYREFGEFDVSYRIAGDFEYVARMFGSRPIKHSYVPEVLVLMQGGGLSNRGWKSKWQITREMHRSCVTHGHRTSWLRLLKRLPLKYLREVVGNRRTTNSSPLGRP